MMTRVREYLGSLDKLNDGLRKKKGFRDFRNKSGADFSYVVYLNNANKSNKNKKGFFIGALFGSNKGVVLITYEGEGNNARAEPELKAILNSLRIH
jgi:hypothetical protein